MDMNCSSIFQGENKMEMRNLYDTLKNTAEKYPGKTGIADEEESITYAELLKRTDNLAAYFTDKIGLKKGMRAGIAMLNSVQYVVCVYAAAKIGIALVLVNVKLHAKEIAYILEDTQIEYIILQSKIWEKISHEVNHTRVKNLILEANVVCEHMENYKIYNLAEGIQYQGKAKTHPVEEKQDVPEPEDTMAVLYTSGTSGVPKGVELCHRAILETVISYKKLLRLDAEQSTLLAVPLFHVTGFSCIMALFIYIGGFMRILPSFHSRRAAAILSEEHIKHFHAVPTIYQMLVNVIDREYDLSGLESAVCGGGYIEDRLMEQFQAIAPNVRFHPAYGMTETAGGGVLFPENYLESSKRGSAGKVMENCEITIFDERNRELPVGEIGQIAFRGPMIIRQYLHGTKEESFIGDWLLSGDVGKLDTDGYIYVLGRLKSMINRGGEKIYSRFVEREICAFSKVNQCMVFPVEDSLYGEVPGCVIVPEKNVSITEQEVRAFLKERIQKTEIPQYIEFWDTLPNTASGKVKVAYLTSLFSEKYSVKEEKEK